MRPNASVDISNILLVAYTGVGWALGQFGKRYGAVEEGGKAGNRDKKYDTKQVDMMRIDAVSMNTQMVIDSFVTIIYMIGACFTGVMPSLLHYGSAYQVLLNHSWQQRIPVSMMLGIGEGMGTFLSVAVVGFAGRHSLSSVAPVIMNSLYVLSCPCFLAVFFGEHVPSSMLAALMFLAIGVFLASGEVERRWSAKESKEGIGPGMLIMIGSLFVAIFWSLGVVGTRYVMQDVPVDLRAHWSSVSYACSVLPMLLAPTITIAGSILIATDIASYKIVAAVKRRCVVAFVCGMISGSGGMCLQYAMADAGNSSARLAGVAQGIYNVACIVMFKVIYQEILSLLQMIGMCALLIGVVILSL
eukprot:TRINITY_DN7845_c0_g1_i1.p1 TRINITY_DN7845_c0_g1~~TRINITY_DN7845_c0_g1_i1.p1  ORF type:complete len:358 (+),score=35.50 TRINITY_DN7845_c0_g1_i1:188-1261(+)